MWIRKLNITLIVLILGASSFGTGYHHLPVEADAHDQAFPNLTDFKIYFSETRGEPSRFDRTSSGISRLAGLLTSFGANLYTLEWRHRIPEDADLVIVPGPMTDFGEDLIARLWVYLNDGGRLLLLADAQPGSPRAILPSMGTLFVLTWTDMGFRARDDIVVVEGPIRNVQLQSAEGDTSNSQEAPGQPSEIEALTVQIDFTTEQLVSGHPITTGINAELAFFATRSIELDMSSADLQITPLVFSNSDFFGETALEVYVDAYGGEYDESEDTPRGRLPLAVAIEDPTADTRIVLLGDREFATNGSGLETSPPYSLGFLHPGNVHFLLNAVAWLLETELEPLTLPTPVPSAAPATPGND